MAHSITTPTQDIMDGTFSKEQKCRLITLTGGLTLIVAGCVYFLISVGLPQSMWLALGVVCLASGGLILTFGLGCSVGDIHTMGSGVLPKEEPAETFVMHTVEDANTTL